MKGSNYSNKDVNIIIVIIKTLLHTLVENLDNLNASHNFFLNETRNERFSSLLAGSIFYYFTLTNAR